MEKDVPITKIYEGEMLDVWEDWESVHLGFGSCTLHFPIGFWQKIKNDFRKISNETPPQNEVGNKCGRPF